MGNTSSIRKSATISVKSYKNVKLPEGYTLFKVATYNINLSNCLTLSEKIKKIVKYVSSSYKDKNHDIICLQGIHDQTSYGQLVIELLNTFKKNITIIPINDEMKYNNIIISFHKIEKLFYKDLFDFKFSSEIYKNNFVIGANINIYGTIVMIFTTELTKDINTIYVDNSLMRKKECEELFNFIKSNIEEKLCIITGSFNIDEYDSDNKINKEYTELVTKYKLFDLFKKFNNKNKSFTNNFKDKKDNIFIYNCMDMYNQYNIYALECYVRNDFNTSEGFQNYPIEAVFMIKNL